MSILKIAKIGHEVLHQVAEPVTNFKDPKLVTLIHDMAETLADSGGIGLAAPQVYVPKRIVIFFAPESQEYKSGQKFDDNLTIMVNPKTIPMSSKTNFDWEACLSVPKLMGSVERYTDIRYSWSDLDGNFHQREAHGFHARVVQHECDHLDGKLYPMRITDFKLFGFSEEVNKNPLLLEQGKFFDEDELMENNG